MSMLPFSSMFREVRRQGVPYFVFTRLEAVSGLVHAFTSRQTDAVLTDAGNPAQVATKKDDLLRVLEVRPEQVATVRQVHSCRVVEAAPAPELPEADAIVLSDPGVFGVIRTADCLPALVIDRQARALCLVHAGWRGTRDHIVGQGVERLLRLTGSSPRDLIVALGPCIRSCCYEVGEEVLEQFAATGHPLDRVARGRHLDLVAANRVDLDALGVTEILDCGQCTACRSDRFYSYRKLGDQGRMWLVAGFRLPNSPP